MTKEKWVDWLPFGVFVYALMFGIFIVPLLFLGFSCLRRGKSLFEKSMGVMALLTPVAGAVFYTTIDYFESRGRTSLWWILIGLIHALPLAANIYIVFKNRWRLIKNI